MLKFNKVSKSFGNVKALSDISFEIQKSEFVFITGPSGAGKSTLLKLIYREYFPDSGEIIFDGQNVVEISRKEIPKLRQKIGIVFQDLKILTERTVRENIEVALAVLAIPENLWLARVNQVLKLVGLESRVDFFPAQLSGGELQRVSLARALITNPKLVLADEPTGNLDWEKAEEIMNLLEKINKEGKTVIVATHHQGLVKKMGKKVIELKEGRILTKEKETEKETEKIKPTAPVAEKTDKEVVKMKAKVEEV